MNLNKELVEQYRNGEIGIYYDGVSLELLRAITGDNEFEGVAKYYSSNFETDDISIVNRYAYTLIPIKDFLLSEVEQWQPQWGEEVQVSGNCCDWVTAFYVGINPMCKFRNVISVDGEGYATQWEYVRKAGATITRAEAEKQLSVKIVD